MKNNIIKASLVALALPALASAADTTLAGWTFSQFLGEGAPSIDAEGFTGTNHIVATYRGAFQPDNNVVDGTVVIQNGSAGYSTATFGDWSFANFDTTNASDVRADTAGGLNNENSVTLDGVNMSLNDAAGMGLSFGLKNTKWSLTVNTTGFTNAATSDFTFAANGVGGAATVEWLVNNTVIGTSSIATGGFATYSLDLPANFYAAGILEGRLTSGSVGTVTFDNVQVNGAAAAIPEPSTYAALAGAFGLALAVYRRRKAA
jgi:hypothetical protein